MVAFPHEITSPPMSLSTKSPLNIQLQASLNSLHQGFLDAIADKNVSDPLEKWFGEFSEIQRKILAGKASSVLSDETLTLSNIVANNVTVIAQGLIDLENSTSTLRSELRRQTQAVIDADFAGPQCPPTQTTTISKPSLSPPQRESKPSLQSHRYPTIPITSALVPVLSSRTPSTVASVTESTRPVSDPSPLPEFIEHAYKFFVANIFNPYPTRAEKEAIVAQTNNERVTFSSISNWFTNARRRCGWTTILKERCDGNREQLVALATRVFVNPDPDNPVDPEIVKDLMEMKEAVETMYERKTRTSAWIEDLENLEDLIHPAPGGSAEKPRETADDRRREQEAQKKEREFEWQKRKMQSEALRKAEKVTKMMQREQAKRKKIEWRTASFAASKSPQELFYEDADEDIVTEPKPVAGGKRKLTTDDDVYRFPDLREVSPVIVRSSSFLSDISSGSRVPSLSWSDSGDERPYKRSRSSPATPPSSIYSSSPRLSPALEIPTNFDNSFTVGPHESLMADDPALDTLFDFSAAPYDTLMGHGKKRVREDAEHEPTPQHKRRRSSQPIVASVGPELVPLPPSSTSTSTPPPTTPLFTPRQSFDATPTQVPHNRSLQLSDLDAVLGFDVTQPPPAQLEPPDASLPIDVGVYDWSSGVFGDIGAGNGDIDFSQLLQFLDNSVPADVPVDLESLDLMSPVFLLPGQRQHTEQHPVFPEDLTGLMSGIISNEVLHDMSADLTASLAATSLLSRESSVVPTVPSVGRAVSTQETSLTPTVLADKALKRELKRKELEEKRAELERERARLAELERELEED